MINSRKKNLPNIYRHYVAAAILLAGFAFMLWQATFNGTVSDESFYLTIPLRILDGQGLLADEWHLTQLSSVLLLPVVKLFTLLNGSTAGMVFFFRMLFCSMQLLLGTVVYITFQDKGAVSIFAAFLTMTIVPLNFYCVSYNTLGTFCVFLCAIMLYRCSLTHRKRLLFFAGALYAGAVLCNPFMASLFVLYVVLFVVFGIKKLKEGTKTKSESKNDVKHNSFPQFFLRVPSAAVFCGGILLIFIYFCAVLFTNSTVSDIAANFSQLFGDPEHMLGSSGEGISMFSASGFLAALSMPAGAPALLLLFLPSAVILCDANRSKNKHIYATAALVCAAAYTVIYYVNLLFIRGDWGKDINSVFFPVTLLGLSCYLLTEKRNSKIFYFFWLPGVFYAFCMAISSNLGMFTMVCGFVISAAASLVLIKDFYDELKNYVPEKTMKKTAEKRLSQTVFNRISAALTAGVLIFICLFPTGAKFTDILLQRFVYVTDYTHMDFGVFKGINLPADQAEIYTNIRTDMLAINAVANDDAYIFVAENIPACYLESSLKAGTYTCWFIGDSLYSLPVRQRYVSYYSLHPDAVPDYVYVPYYVYTINGIKEAPEKYLLELTHRMFSGKITEGEGGYIIKVTGFNGAGL